jgi:hypothetical protein
MELTDIKVGMKFIADDHGDSGISEDFKGKTITITQVPNKRTSSIMYIYEDDVSCACSWIMFNKRFSLIPETINNQSKLVIGQTWQCKKLKCCHTLKIKVNADAWTITGASNNILESYILKHMELIEEAKIIINAKVIIETPKVTDPFIYFPIEIKIAKPHYNHAYNTLMAKLKRDEGYINPVMHRKCSYNNCTVCSPKRPEPFISSVDDYDLLPDVN